VPSLFRRKSTDLVTDAVAEVESSTDGAVATDDASESAAERATSKAYTPSKGRATPKRGSAGPRRTAEPPPKTRREAYKRMRDRQKVERTEAREDRAKARAAMMAGDEKYLLPRDKGPERRLVRNIVDSRRNVGTWFFGGLFIVLLGSSTAWPMAVQFGANLLWVFLALALIVDSFLLARRVKRTVLDRFPKTDQVMWRLQGYAVMRSITFRRMRIPAAVVKLGDPV
jgi:hypothetical protein